MSAFSQAAKPAPKATNPEQRTSRYFETTRSNPLLLAAFLRQMPKGGDLHNHLSGSVYAESYIAWAAEDGLCIDRAQMAFVAPPCEAPKVPAKNALTSLTLHRALVDAMSVRDFQPTSGNSGHDQFFDSFAKFGLATRNRMGDMLAEVAERAADQNQWYLELMGSPLGQSPAPLGMKVGWSDDFAQMRTRLLEAGMADVVASARKAIDQGEQRKREILHCGTAEARPACNVQVRYIGQASRNAPREIVFAQMVSTFELAQADPRYVGVTLVAPEDGHVSMRDFALHMRMLEFLHQQYPKVHITLHAGELTPGLVPPEGLRNHVRDSVERAHAERIGHGVDVMFENDPVALLKEMAQRKVLVEICLTSNDTILGVRGAQHPLPLFLKYGVPVTLATDDQGVARSNITAEYQRAAQTYGLRYAELKRLARMSLEHSFLPGESLWKGDIGHRIEACASDMATARTRSAACDKFLNSSERASAQWRLEQQFAAFEAQY